MWTSIWLSLGKGLRQFYGFQFRLWFQFYFGCRMGSGVEVVYRQGVQLLGYGSFVSFGVDDGRVDVLFFERGDFRFFLRLVQRFVQFVVVEALVVFFEVYSFQDEVEFRGFGYVYFRFFLVARQYVFGGVVFDDGYYQVDYFFDLVRYEVLFFYFDYCKFYVFSYEGFFVVYVQDVALGVGFSGFFLRGEVVEVVGVFVVGQEFVYVLQRFCRQSVGFVLYVTVFVGKGERGQYVEVGFGVIFVFGVEVVRDFFQFLGRRGK